MAWANSSYLWKRKITLNQASGGSDLTNFPVLISTTQTDLKTVGNGGVVNNASGYDIIFYNAAENTLLSHEIESYTASTGAILFWVNVPTLSGSTTTDIYMYYGYPGVANAYQGAGTQASTWTTDGNFKGVYHLGNGTTLSASDSTGANNGTISGTTASSSGKIDGCASFTASSSNYIGLAGIAMSATQTYAFWVNPTTLPTYAALLSESSGNYGMYLNAAGKIDYWYSNTDHVSTAAVSTGSWSHLTLTVSSGSVTFYINGTTSGTATGAPTTLTLSRIGSDYPSVSSLYNGLMDEVHISSVVRTSGWITTEYTNQNAPASFITVGSALQNAVTKTTNVRTRISVKVTKSVGVRFIERVTAARTAGVRFLERVQKTVSIGLRTRLAATVTKSVPMRLRYQTVAFTKSAVVRFLQRVQKTVSAPLRSRINVQKTVSAPTRARVRVTKTTNLPVRLRYQTIPFTKSVGVRLVERVTKTVSAPLRSRLAVQSTSLTSLRLRERVQQTKTAALRTRLTVQRTLSSVVRARVAQLTTRSVPVRLLLQAGTIASKYLTVRLRLNVAQSLSAPMRFLYRTIFDMLKVKAWDTFHRADQSGWGTASDGTDLWSFAGAAYTASIVSNEGKLTGTTGVGVGILGSNTIADGAALVGLNAVNSTSDEAGIVLRYTDINNFYYAKATGGHLYLAQMVAGTPTNLTNSVITQATNTSYWLRFYVAGTKLRARWWSKDVAEPGSWMLVTSSSLTGAHQYGVYYNAAVTTNSVLFDNFEVDFSTRVMSAQVRLVLQVTNSVTAGVRTLLSVGKTLTAPIRARLQVRTTRSTAVRFRYQTIAFTRSFGVRLLERVQRSVSAPLRARISTQLARSTPVRTVLKVLQTRTTPIRTRLTVLASRTAALRTRIATLTSRSVPARLLLRVSRSVSSQVRVRLAQRATSTTNVRSRIRQLATVSAPVRFIFQSLNTTKSFGVRLRERVQRTVVAQLRTRLSVAKSLSTPLRLRYQSIAFTRVLGVRLVERVQKAVSTQIRARLSTATSRSMPLRLREATQQSGVAQVRARLTARNTRTANVRGRVRILATVSAPVRFIYQTLSTTKSAHVRLRLVARISKTIGLRTKLQSGRTSVAPIRFVLYIPPPSNMVLKVRKGALSMVVRNP